MERMTTTLDSHGPSPATRPAIFGLRYLEEEAAEVHDVVGCLVNVNRGTYTGTGCDDHDSSPIYLV